MPEYYCECCDYIGQSKTHYDRHMKSKRHKDSLFKTSEAYKKIQEEGEIMRMKVELEKLKLEVELARNEKMKIEEKEEKSKLLFNGQNENTSSPIDDVRKIVPCGSNFMGLGDFINDNDRLMIMNCGFARWFTDFLPRFIEHLGGITKSPIICSDIRRKRIYFHLKDLGWVEDISLKRFTSFINYLSSTLYFGIYKNSTELRNEFFKTHKVNDVMEFMGPLLSWNQKKTIHRDINEQYCFKELRDFALEYLNRL